LRNDIFEVFEGILCDLDKVPDRTGVRADASHSRNRDSNARGGVLLPFPFHRILGAFESVANQAKIDPFHEIRVQSIVDPPVTAHLDRRMARIASQDVGTFPVS
jgi:hypothetical protein